MPMVKEHIYNGFKFEIKKIEINGKEPLLEVKMKSDKTILSNPLVVYRMKRSEFTTYKDLFKLIIEAYYEKVEREVFRWSF